jgi:hypothetical protein
VNNFEVKIWDDERRFCTFYTVQFEDSEENETDKFFLRFENIPTYESDAQALLSFILLSIGEDHGAIDELLNRYEEEVIGLPVKGTVRLGEITYDYPDFPLRIYVLKITDEIVVLFNGGLKDGPTNITSSLHHNWVEACEFARKIIDGIKDGAVVVDKKNRKLLNENGTEEIFL